METIITPEVRTVNTRWMNLVIETRMVIYAIHLVFTRKLKAARFFRYLRRLLLFLTKMKGNKYIRVAEGVKINLYVPAFPSKAFFYATHKMLAFEKKMPAITALVSVTSACRYNCEHCYQKMDKGKDVDLESLVGAVKYFQDQGVAFFNIEGGDPFLVYPRLKALCESIDDRSEILINSTGNGITKERLLELKECCNLLGIMFSLHTSEPEKQNTFMGTEEAWPNMLQGIQCCHETGVPVMFNSCLPRRAYYDGGFEKLMDRARELGGTLLQLIKPKSAGGWLLEGAEEFSQDDLGHIRKKALEYNTSKKYRSYPFIAAMIIDEDADHFGCTAGGTDRFYLNAKGDLQPCEFLNLSFGNISKEPVEEIYERMRSTFVQPGCNWLCEVYHEKIAKKVRGREKIVLPLPPIDTMEILNTEDHGKIPDFYDRANKI
jgi:MoaA/NifB/PqqE/SkfB family radical SAM enzyme